MNRSFNIFTLIIIGILFSFSGCKDNDVTGVSIIPEICVLYVGESRDLTAIVSPDNADDKSVKWKINNIRPMDTINGQDVASISDNGKVKGLAEGYAQAVCITNNMFCEAQAIIMVGYAVAVKGNYTGSLSENGNVINTAAKIGIEHVSEYEARFNMPFLVETDSVESCLVTVKKQDEKTMAFNGTNIIDIQGIMTPVQVNGRVSLDGMGDFEVILSTDPAVTKYTFFGTIDNRPF